MKNIHQIGKNIYITNDEQIKEGDWIFNDKTEPSILTSILMFIGRGILRGCKKIILTTDQNLIADGVQAIDEEFLEWFVKNSNCESVDVVKCRGYLHLSYMIMIPQEEPKQETLEEAAEKWNEKQTTLEFGKPHNSPNRIKSFIDGAKWQEKRMYSEEDMVNFAFDTYYYISKIMEVPFNQISENKLHAIENLKQFKNKQ
jgi:hypothetical protein